jgi:redox-sensitive bicupin YhaK (pirin superfamily)
MNKILRSNERGLTDLGWLKSYHSFSFGEYYDPENKGFRSLRVINDDYIEAGSGFDFHPHHDMEILTMVLSGAVTHIDNMGNSEIIRAGEFQLMSAGTGVLHSEHNFENEELRLLQIWIKPREKGLKPSYQQTSLEQLSFDDNGFRMIASGFTGSSSGFTDDSCLKINQDIEIKLISNLEAESILVTLDSKYNQLEQQSFDKKSFMGIYFHVIEGVVDIELAGSPLVKLSPGDGFNLGNTEKIKLLFEPMTKCLIFCFI